jgi:vacuolar protein sorting-associated protein 8
VTALAVSYDHTFVASGHASGHIQLFEVQNPKMPARFVPPTTMAVVASGREEGHLVGSRIVSIGFIAGRHTAIVSADDSGLAFYHSLGKVLFVDATDTLRILGKYPDEDPSELPNGPIVPGLNISHPPFRRRRMRKANTILSMSPLPLGPSPHSTDAYQLIALLTPAKLVVVGLKPTPKTWYRAHREVDDDPAHKSRMKGVLAWFPSVPSGNVVQQSVTGKNRTSQPEGLLPMLVYGWGNSLNLLRISESKALQDVKNPKTGKVTKVEVGRVVIQEAGRWTVDGDVLALQWLNVNVGSSDQIYVLRATHSNCSILRSKSSCSPLRLWRSTIRTPFVWSNVYCLMLGHLYHHCSPILLMALCPIQMRSARFPTAYAYTKARSLC